MIGVQDFGKAKNYKPTWTKTSLRLVFVLRWNQKSLKSAHYASRVSSMHCHFYSLDYVNYFIFITSVFCFFDIPSNFFNELYPFGHNEPNVSKAIGTKV